MQISLENDREDNSVIRHHVGMSMNQMRHLEVSRVIEARQVDSLIDLGCSEGLLLQKLSRSEDLRLVVGVDLDETAVTSAVINTFPENIQQCIQFRRQQDQHLYIYYGDATKKHLLLKQKNAQLVTLVELIEHLPPADLPNLLENVFGYLRPEICFVSTPNREFNVFFNFTEGQMRHWDHKFEWSRAEFEDFCNGVRTTYGYEFTLGGIGEHVSDQSKGHCTQYALFTRPSTALANQKEGIADDNELEERAHYQNKCWRNNRDKIIKNTLFKSLYYSSDLTFAQGLEFFRKEPIGVCLQKDGETVDRSFLLACLQQNREDFEWADEKYRVKHDYQSESESDEEMIEQSQSQENQQPGNLLEDASSYELSISRSNIFEKDSPVE